MPSRPTGPFAAFRIADDRYPLLDGGGAFRLGGRWNSPGRYVVYTSLGFAAAMLEKLVRARIGRIPSGQQLADILVPGHVSVEEIGPADLPGWNSSAQSASRAYGDAWYDGRRAAALIVPSLPAMGYERNLLLNQLHPEFGEITASRPRPVIWDARLFASTG
jgi:RES domain-containing protein